MTSFAGLKLIDLAMIAGYFAAVLAIGFWASRKVKSEDDFFLGGRRFGTGLLMMHWLCTGTHSEMAVQVAGATARVGLGGIWYQWMWLFSTPFYWLIAPITRRLRVTTTGDFFRIRYGKSLEMLYTLVALFFFALSIALLLRGAGAAISGATGGAIPTQVSVIALSILFSTYVMAGGLVAAAYTDVLQGLMIIALSVLLVPSGLGLVGGFAGLRQKLPPSFFAITAPHGAPEGDPWFVITMSILGLVGIVVQPHVMTATGSGKTETEARVGMVYGNFIKRLLTIAWAFTGLIALAAFPHTACGARPGQPARCSGERGLVRPGHPALPGRRLARADDRLLDRRRHKRRDLHGRRLGPFHAQFLRPCNARAFALPLPLGWPSGRRRTAGAGHSAGTRGRERDAARARIGQGDRPARGRLLAGRGLEAREYRRRLGQLRGQPAGLGCHEYGQGRHAFPEWAQRTAANSDHACNANSGCSCWSVFSRRLPIGR